MKKTRSMLAISVLGVMLLAGMNSAIASEGLTIGYWKNHTDGGEWVGYSTDQTLEDVFDLPAAYEHLDATLLEALKFKGGRDLDGAARLLLKQAVAALLNIAHPDIKYSMSENDLFSDVNHALTYYGSDRGMILKLKDLLDGWNNKGLD